MKILLIGETLKVQSGWGRYAKSVMDETRRRGHTVDVLTAVKKEKTGEELAVVAKPSAWNFFLHMWKIRRLARSYDIVHALDCWPFAVYGWAAVIGTKKQLFITGVGTYSVAPFDYPLKRFFLSFACRRAKKIFSIANYTKQRMLEKINLSNIVTVYWGTTPLPEITEEERIVFEREFGLPKERNPMLITVGQIKHRKGQFDTLQAVAKVREKYPNIFYAMVGSDTDRGYIKKIQQFITDNHLERNAAVISNVNNDRALSFFYQQTDIFLMNSNNEGGHFEGFGLVFLEAEQFGKPVIGSRGCGIEEALEDGFNGYLTEQGNSDDIADKIIKVLDGDTQRLGNNSKDFFKRFNWQKTVDQHLQYYLEVV